jgi:transketolase
MDTMRERFATVVSELVEDTDDIAVVFADIGRDQFAGAMRRHPARVVNVGIREQLMVGVAAGMALEGFRPIIHSYTPFLVERPYEQIKLDFAHQGVGGVFVSIGASYDAAGAGRTHQAPEDVALMATIPGMSIHVPGHPDEVETLLRVVVPGEGLHYVRLDGRANSQRHEPGIVRRGSRGSPVVVAVGPLLDRVLAATETLDVTVTYTTEPFRPSLPDDASDVVVIEPMLEGTSTHAVSRLLRDHPHRILAIGVPLAEHRRYGTPEDHDRTHGLDTEGIRTAIAAFIAP